MTNNKTVQTSNIGTPHQLLHVMIRVKDLEKSINFYTNLLGMKVNESFHFPKEKFTIVFLGYKEKDQTTIELTYNWDQNSYEMGTAFGHIALASSDIYNLCSHLKKNNVKVIREAGPMKDGPEIAIIEDPDGYKIELIQFPFSK